MVEYDCEGCGAHVYSYGHDTRPATFFCASCDWADKFCPDRTEMVEVLRLQGCFGTEREERKQPK